ARGLWSGKNAAYAYARCSCGLGRAAPTARHHAGNAPCGAGAHSARAIRVWGTGFASTSPRDAAAFEVMLRVASQRSSRREYTRSPKLTAFSHLGENTCLVPAAAGPVPRASPDARPRPALSSPQAFRFVLGLSEELPAK